MCLFRHSAKQSQRSRNGSCRVSFVGALAYADDLVLLALSANALRCMLQICDKYAAQCKVVFKASKI